MCYGRYMNKILVAQNNSLKAFIEPDEDAISPFDNDDRGIFLMADHRQCYIIPTGYKRGFDREQVCEDMKETHHVFGLEAYIHGGVALALSGQGDFPDRQWDVSQLGAVFVSKEEWPEIEEARLAAEALVEEWNTYLSGDVWCVSVQNGEDENVETLCGVYKQAEAEKEARQMLANAVKQRDTIPTIKAIQGDLREITTSLASILNEMLCDAETLKAPFRNKSLCEKARQVLKEAKDQGVQVA